MDSTSVEKLGADDSLAQRTHAFDRVWATIQERAPLEHWAPDATSDGHSVRERAERIMQMSLESLPVMRVSMDEQRAAAPHTGEHTQLVIRDTLGTGGMGVVYLARQKTLHRDVAVKTLKHTVDPGIAQREVLKEAWITGRLEHPNIVPIHALGLDPQGKPILIMKRIEGVNWFDVLHDATLYPASAEGEDVLERHLRVLMQVCRAAHFAHTRGVLHRDIKPENVMVGAHGDVYLVDWGIAVSLIDHGDGVLPLAKNVDRPGGTPAYMAPEMVEGLGKKLSVATDVYLLGATLHHALTGQPPHRGGDVREVLRRAYVSAPHVYRAHVPDELARIAQKAMHPEPMMRYRDVEEFRTALAEFLNHRDSYVLSRSAMTSLTEVVRLAPAAVEDDTTYRELHGAYMAARFGFAQALHIWEGNEQARLGMIRLLEQAIDTALARRAPDVARAVIGELIEYAKPSDDVRERLAALERDREDEAKRLGELEGLAREHDVTVSAYSRAAFLMVWTVLWTFSAVRKHFTPPEPWSHAVEMGVIIVAVLISVWALRHRILTTRVNRSIISALVMALANIVLVRVMVASLGIAPLEAILAEVIVYGLATGMLAAMVDLRLFFTPLVYFVVSILVAVLPAYAWLWVGVGHFFALSAFAFVWASQHVQAQSEEPASGG